MIGNKPRRAIRSPGFFFRGEAVTAAERKAKLETALDRVIEELSAGNIKPDYSINGQSVSWTRYRESLLEQQKALTEAIDTLGDDDGGIVFEITEGRTC